MIVNITKGKSARGGLAYDYGPGNKEEHENPRRVAGNVPGRTYQQRASRFDRAQKSYIQQTGRTPKQPVVRMAVAASPEDAKMSDRQWGQIAHQTVDKFTGGKADKYPWEAVRHDDGHIHITLSRCGTDGKLLTSSNDYRRAQVIGRDIEKRHGLYKTPGRVLGKQSDKEREVGRTEAGDTALTLNGRVSDDRTVSGRDGDMPIRETNRRHGEDKFTREEGGQSMAERRQQVLRDTAPHSDERRQALSDLRDQESQQRGTSGEVRRDQQETRGRHGGNESDRDDTATRSRSVDQDRGDQQPEHESQQAERSSGQSQRAREHDEPDSRSSQTDKATRDRQRILETTQPGSPERQQALRDLRQGQEQQTDHSHQDGMESQQAQREQEKQIEKLRQREQQRQQFNGRSL